MYLSGDGFCVAAKSVLGELGQLHGEKGVSLRGDTALLTQASELVGGNPSPARLPTSTTKDDTRQTPIPRLLRARMRAHPPPAPGLEALLDGKGNALEKAQGLPMCWAHRRAGLLLLFTGAQPTPSFVPVFILFECSLRCLGKTYQGAGGALAHLGQDTGFSTGGCQNPEDWKEQGEDGQDAIHLGERETRDSSQRAAGPREGGQGLPRPGVTP